MDQRHMKMVFLNDVVYAYARALPSAVGGAERQQWLLARALAANGWSVTVGVREAMRIGERNIIDRVEFVGIGRDQILSAWNRFLRAEQADWWYWRCASHWWGPAVGLAKLVGVRTIFATALDSDVQPRRAHFHHHRWWPLYAWGLANTDRIFLQHGGQYSHLPQRCQTKAYIVPSIFGQAMVAKSHTERARYVAWVAMLGQAKRPDLLVRIAREAPSIRFVVCGGPTTFMSPAGYGEDIVAQLRALPNVEYRGQIPSENALKVIAEAAVLLSTSDEEGFPNTFLQAWSMGTPVVSLKIDPDSIITRTGLGVVSNNIDCAIAEIKSLLDSPGLRDQIAVRAGRYIAETHSEAAVLNALISAIRGNSPMIRKMDRGPSEAA